MRAFTHWRWHLDEVQLKINIELHDLWRAADQEGEGLDSFASKTRDKAAALAFMKKLMRHHGRANAITTDGLRSCKDAMKEIAKLTNRQLAGGVTAAPRTHICLSHDRNGRCSASGR